MSPTTDTEAWLTHDEAAAYLRRTPTALHQLRYRGDGPPAYRVAGGKLLYSRAELDEWIRSYAGRSSDAPRTT